MAQVRAEMGSGKAKKISQISRVLRTSGPGSEEEVTFQAEGTGGQEGMKESREAAGKCGTPKGK